MGGFLESQSMENFPMTQNPEGKRGKNDEFYFCKNKELLHDKKKKKKICTVEDKVKKMFLTNDKKNCERFLNDY